MNRLLRPIRIVVSLMVFAVLAVGTAMPLWAIPGVYERLVEIQLGWAVTVMSLTVFVVWIIITLVFGRIYCSSVCPMGTLMDLSGGLRRLTPRGRRRVYRWTEPNNTLRYCVLILVIICIVGGFMLIPSVVDPYSAFRRIMCGFVGPVAEWLSSRGVAPVKAAFIVKTTLASAMIATFVFAVTVVIAYQNGRALCNSICPIGTVLGMVSRYSVFQMDIDTDKCTQCRRCEYACKAHCINLDDHVVDGSRCVNCFDCLSVCRDDAIHYTTDRKRLSQPLLQKIGSLTSPAEEGEAETTMDAPNNQITNNNNINETIS